eukprot:1752273-Alexandrium_andersonii.AAC.1
MLALRERIQGGPRWAIQRCFGWWSMPERSSPSTSWATMAVPRSSGFSARPAGTTGASSASRCITVCGRATWAGA